ncbi:MAG: ROK family protein [Elusimicrobia bacterium]|nr:ROK family protein [Elusimicrobiota bacterium]
MRGRLGVGVDTGGTFTKIVAVTPTGRAVRERQIPTEAEAGPGPFVRRVAAAVGELERELGRRARGIGLGLAGDVDSARGRLRFSPNLRRFSGYPLRDALARATGRKVLVENDANMAAWGGYVVELKRRARNVVAVSMGTGIGGGLVLDGRLYHGSTGSAAELGHTRVDDGGERCNCGARGCVEAYAGSYGIVRTALRLIRGRSSLIKGLCPDLRRLEPRLIAEAAAQGDAAAREVWEETGRRLGLAITNAVYLLNPDVVLIVGGVSRAGRLILDPVERVLRRQPFRTPFSHVQVRIARTPNLGAVGAGLLALESLRAERR